MRLLAISLALLLVIGLPRWSGAQPAAGRWVADSGTGCAVWIGGDLVVDRVSWSGACQDGHAEGRGVMRRFAGDRVEAEHVGEYHDGRRAGQGAVNGANGVHYEGAWRDDQYDGRGTFHDHDGNEYQGDWHQGRPSGRGAWRYADGERYEGALRDGDYAGRGVYTWPNGDRYEGEFQGGRPDGPGTLRAHDGKVYRGTRALGCLKRGGALIAVLLTELASCQ